MKIKKTISVTATEKELRVIGNFLALLEEMEEDVWSELNESMDYHLEEVLDIGRDLYKTLEKEDD